MKVLKYFAITSLLLILLSCSDDFIFNDLDKPPLDQIGNGEFWSTPQDLENYALQFYPQFSLSNSDGIVADPSLGSDLSIQFSPNEFINGSWSTPTSGGGWNWDEIRAVNIFLENYERVDASFESISHFVGEVHFFKAMLYFEKLSTFGDVPWYTNTLQTDSEELFKPRDSREVVADSILWHLDQAIELLDPISSVNGGTNRLNKETALAFQSRVALFEGSWQKYHAGTEFGDPGVNTDKYFAKSVEAAEELMSGEYRVGIYNTGNSDSDYFNLFGMSDYSNIDEILLWKNHDQSIGVSHNALLYVTDRTNGRGGTFARLDSYLDRNGDIFNYRQLTEQIRGNEYLEQVAEIADPRFSQTFYIPGDVMYDNENGRRVFDKPFLSGGDQFLNRTGFQFKKGNNPNLRGSGANFGGNSETGFIFFRYAEVLLNYAEAKYELDGNVDYENSINLLRRRAGMPDFQIPNGDQKYDYGYPIDAELYEIRRERTLELAEEGFRRDDLRRWRAHNLFQNQRPKGYPFNPDEWDVDEVLVPTDEEGFMDPYRNVIPNGYGFQESRDYLNPIPIDELTLNENLEQNPGW